MTEESVDTSYLIPSPWHISPLDRITPEELRYLGRETLLQLAGKWIIKRRWLSLSYEVTESVEAFLKGKTKKAIAEIASKYIHVQFEQKLRTADLYRMAPNPMLTGQR